MGRSQRALCRGPAPAGPTPAKPWKARTMAALGVHLVSLCHPRPFLSALPFFPLICPGGASLASQSGSESGWAGVIGGQGQFLTAGSPGTASCIGGAGCTRSAQLWAHLAGGGGDGSQETSLEGCACAPPTCRPGHERMCAHAQTGTCVHTCKHICTRVSCTHVQVCAGPHTHAHTANTCTQAWLRAHVACA